MLHITLGTFLHFSPILALSTELHFHVWDLFNCLIRSLLPKKPCFTWLLLSTFPCGTGTPWLNWFSVMLEGATTVPRSFRFDNKKGSTVTVLPSTPHCPWGNQTPPVQITAISDTNPSSHLILATSPPTNFSHIHLIRPISLHAKFRLPTEFRREYSLARELVAAAPRGLSFSWQLQSPPGSVLGLWGYLASCPRLLYLGGWMSPSRGSLEWWGPAWKQSSKKK